MRDAFAKSAFCTSQAIFRKGVLTKMKEFVLIQTDYLVRVLAAALCGLVVGYERKTRLKLAGIRTHTIIAMAAALMVVVSKYGFFDVIHIDGVSEDTGQVL